MPLHAKLRVFSTHYFWRTKCKSTKTITEQCISCQNKSICQKLARSCKTVNRSKKPQLPTHNQPTYMSISQSCNGETSLVWPLLPLTTLLMCQNIQVLLFSILFKKWTFCKDVYQQSSNHFYLVKWYLTKLTATSLQALFLGQRLCIQVQAHMARFSFVSQCLL